MPIDKRTMQIDKKVTQIDTKTMQIDAKTMLLDKRTMQIDKRMILIDKNSFEIDTFSHRELGLLYFQHQFPDFFFMNGKIKKTEKKKKVKIYKNGLKI